MARIPRLDAVGGYDRVYLSPHLDDAALSCGGLLLDDARAGRRVLVVTLFDAPWTERPAEEAAAMRRLGVDHLLAGFLDAPYRSAHYQRFINILFDRDPNDIGHRDRAESFLAELLDRAGPDELLAPLAVGGHVDHVLTFEAATRVAAGTDQRLALYEDRPYCFMPEMLRIRMGILSVRGAVADLEESSAVRIASRFLGGLISATASGAGWSAVLDSSDLPVIVGGVVELLRQASRPPQRTLHARCTTWPADILAELREVVSCYASQLPLLFRDLDDWELATRRHADRLGHVGEHVERTWTWPPEEVRSSV